MTKNIDKAILKTVVKEILIEDRELLKDIMKELLADEVRAHESSTIGDEEIRLLAKRQFKKYANVFKALAQEFMRKLTKTGIITLNKESIINDGGNFMPPSNLLNESNLDYLIEIVDSEMFYENK